MTVSADLLLVQQYIHKYDYVHKSGNAEHLHSSDKSDLNGFLCSGNYVM